MSFDSPIAILKYSVFHKDIARKSANPLISLASPVLSRIDIPPSNGRSFRFINTRQCAFLKGRPTTASSIIVQSSFSNSTRIPISHAVPVRANARAITHERSAFSHAWLRACTSPSPPARRFVAPLHFGRPGGAVRDRLRPTARAPIDCQLSDNCN